jgi:crotonobetainyl-CoA:carnitine CoA-transferase CaiB-like acyl-CoA transferase
MAGPLDGLLVIEVANWIAGPCCGALLADAGATVIKVEPPEGDSMRYVQRQPASVDGKPQHNGECIDHSFTLDNRGKKSIAVDLTTPEGQQVVRALAAKADVFLTNLLPGRLARFGLDYATVDASNPRVVYCSVSGWGLKGPHPDKLAFDMTAFFARGGIMGLWGEPDQPPVKPRSGQGDHQTGLAAYASITTALLLRGKTNKGSLCETSLIRAATWNIGEDLACALVDGKQPGKTRTDADGAATRCYQCADGRWIIVMMPFREDHYWPRFCAVLGKPEWAAAGGEYSTRSQRVGSAAARMELGAKVQEILRRRDMRYWLEALEAGGCIAGPVATLPEVCADPQLRANGAFRQVTHPVAGTFETVAAPFNLHRNRSGGSSGGSGGSSSSGNGDGSSSTRDDDADVDVIRPRGPGPELGVHTASVLHDTLGLSEAEVKALTACGAVGARMIPNSPIANWSAKL